MEITRNVIMDLMPLYVAGEVSEDTRRLVEAYLEQDEDLKRLAERVEEIGLKEVPMLEQKEVSLEQYEKASQMRFFRTLALVVFIVGGILAVLALGGALAAFFLLP